MNPHPVDIAKELRQFKFFQSFSDDLLLQVSTMTELASFKKGQNVLEEGQTNKNLYFLRKGAALVVLAGEVVTILQLPGEVMGEMSVITGKPATTTIQAGTDIECFVLNSENFVHVNPKDRDHFLAILYRIYSNILADRLEKTNEKARLFEIANRELHQAQVTLNELGDGRVLLVEADRKQLVMAKMAVGATGVTMDVASDLDTGLDFYKTNKYDAVICDESNLDLLNHIYAEKGEAKLVFMTSKEVQQNLPLLKNMMSIDNLITRDPDDRSFTMRMILTTLTKLLTNDIFGVDKYLTWGVDVQTESVKASYERDELKERMSEYFRNLGVRSTIIDRCTTVTEEMLMNAIYDAPTDPSGKSMFNHLSRQTEVILESHLQSELSYACDGVLLGISVADPFGGLTKKTVVDYLESCYSGNAGGLNEGKGGAGRGLHQIIENADLTIFNVKKGVKTEVICLFYVEGHKREVRPSFHYFFTK
jgi:CRP-like cAMP-binding protein